MSQVAYKKLIDQQLVNKLIEFLQYQRKISSKTGLHKVIVGMSGEIGSLVAGALLKQAIGADVCPVIVDFDMSDNPDVDTDQTKFALSQTNFLGLQCIIVKAGKLYKEHLSLNHPKNSEVESHLKTRFINSILMQTADNLSGVVVDSTDKTQRLLGFYPSDYYGYFMPLYSFYTSEIYDLAKFLNIPDNLILKTSSNGIEWEQMDLLIFLLSNNQLTPEQISQDYRLDINWVRKLSSSIEKQFFVGETGKLII